jgi:hypothetical protein
MDNHHRETTTGSIMALLNKSPHFLDDRGKETPLMGGNSDMGKDFHIS